MINKEEILKEIDRILLGIDKDECSDDNAWWATSTGAEFGKETLDLLKQFISNTIDYKPEEFIICAANLYLDGQTYANQPTNVHSGFVIAGRRHHNCIAIFAKIYPFPYGPIAQSIYNSEVQGFLTNTNRFVDRKEAYTIAYNANQIIGPHKGIPFNEIGLCSEDLY